MDSTIVERHQIAGLDERERGFSRLTEVERANGGYRAVLRYEATTVTTEPWPRVTQALGELVRLLHGMGYRQLRSRPNFRGATYLGSQEMWSEYPDPEGTAREPAVLDEQLARRTGWIRRVLKLFSQRSA